MNKEERLSRDKDIIDDYINGVLSSNEIIRKYSLKSQTYYDILKRNNVKTRSISEGCKLASKNGIGCRPMKDRMTNSNGYIFIRVGNEKVLEHVYVYEKYLGRKLLKDEVIHHIDGNKQNNTIENLILLTQKEHANIHMVNILNMIGEGIKNGYIIFDKNNKEYKWV